ncbi:MAG TPA: isoprenylcysteine carboxylmethyltransferase family protein [Burkholderiaceae bacterium]|nr:isoprenylcysteine carboxylmethyltransferase family protein [Burkholderiaceae bacterium]
METMIQQLELRVPPPIIALLTALLMGSVAWGIPGLHIPLFQHKVLAVVLAAAGMATGLAAVISFVRARTTADPRRPEEAQHLVRSGIYRFSRNPMYLGLFLILLGWGYFLANAAALALLIIFIAAMTRLQIVPEERALQKRFGIEFDEYRGRVRRWI